MERGNDKTLTPISISQRLEDGFEMTSPSPLSRISAALLLTKFTTYPKRAMAAPAPAGRIPGGPAAPPGGGRPSATSYEAYAPRSAPQRHRLARLAALTAGPAAPPNAGGGGVNGESVDYQFGSAITNVNVTGSGTAVNYQAFNTVDNSLAGGQRRLVADFETRGAGFNFGSILNPIIDHVGWQFVTGGTSMQTSPEALSIQMKSEGNVLRPSIPTFSGTSGGRSWYTQRSNTNTVELVTTPEFDEQWSITGVGFVMVRSISSSLTAVFDLSDSSQTTIVLTPIDEVNFAEHTAGEIDFGEVFVGLDVSTLPGNVSITGVSFILPGDTPADIGVDDLTLILSPVPEPGSLGLTLLGLSFLATGRRLAHRAA